MTAYRARLDAGVYAPPPDESQPEQKPKTPAKTAKAATRKRTRSSSRVSRS